MSKLIFLSIVFVYLIAMLFVPLPLNANPDDVLCCWWCPVDKQQHCEHIPEMLCDSRDGKVVDNCQECTGN